MANKKAVDLGIGTFMNQVKKNKSTKAMDKENEEIITECQEEVITAEVEIASVDSSTSKEPQKQSEKKNNTPETLLRNVALTPETLYRLETVRKMQDKRISLGGLMGAIIEEYLDINYPQTKELYQLMESMKKTQ